MKIGSWFLMVVLCASFTQAVVFSDDTTFDQGNIKFLFKAGVEIEGFDLVNGGIDIEDRYKYVFGLEGGSITVTFTQDPDEILLSSSVPQTLSFKITRDGAKHYLKLDNSYFVDEMSVAQNEVLYRIEPVKTDENIIVTEVGEKPGWGERKITYFTIGDQTLFVKNKTVIWGVVILISVIVFLTMIRRALG